MKTGSLLVGMIPALIIIGLLGLGMSPAQAPPSDSEADRAYTQHDWPMAQKLYSSLTQAKPENARYWYRLAMCRRANKEYTPALDAFRKAGELGAGKGLPKSTVDYELASTYAGMGDRANALKLLKDAADAGFLQLARVESDTEWNSLRSDAQFTVLARAVKHNAQPCDDPEFAQFDFWVGDWDVASTGDGVARGGSHVSKEMGGCVVRENWTSAGSPYFARATTPTT